MKCGFIFKKTKTFFWMYRNNNFRFFVLEHQLRKRIKKIIKMGYRHFIVEMTAGIGTLFAELIIQEKKHTPSITLECVLPCIGYEKSWSWYFRDKLMIIFSYANKISFAVKGDYQKYCIQKAKNYILEKSSVCIITKTKNFFISIEEIFSNNLNL